MDRTERFYKIHQLLESRRVVPREIFLDELGVSLATLKRDLEYMRERLHAPIVWDPASRGYRFDATPEGPTYALPGMWFNASEAHALLTMQRLLENLQPGLLDAHIKPLRTRIRALLETGDHSIDEVQRRIRILHAAARSVQPRHFEVISTAVLRRKRLIINHYSRSRDEEAEREISPLRLVYYRDNWYLDAWCHVRNALRSFAVDTIRKAVPLDCAASELPDQALDAEFEAGYGIFAGRDTRIARLRFSAERARWVAGEQWHPKQEGRYDREGRYVLEVPYSDDRELIMDILKHGPEVEVLGPGALRDRVARTLGQALRQYR
jgi:predicted DNA-binding transcriptional regulator YafY